MFVPDFQRDREKHAPDGESMNDRDGNGKSGKLLGSTVESFAGRMRRRLKEQEAVADESGKAREIRQKAMLEALNTIRRALQEACRIQLSSRFRFELDVSDWEGWPRLQLTLIDDQNGGSSPHCLQVGAHDHNDTGTIEIRLTSGTVLGRLEFANPDEPARLPAALKRALRHFLELVSAYVLNPTPTITKADPIQVDSGSIEERPEAAELKKVDFDLEEIKGDENLVEDVEVKTVPIEH